MMLSKTNTDTLQHKAGQAVDEASETIQKFGHRIEGSLQQAKEGLVEMQSAISGRASATADATDRFAHEHPWKSIGLATAAGVIIGILIGMRR
jgi:ElaB/YqjD/DUF883 family membrane-anchored ribosome-binding protein